MTSQWARRGMRRGNIKYSSGGAILNTQNDNMRDGNTINIRNGALCGGAEARQARARKSLNCYVPID